MGRSSSWIAGLAALLAALAPQAQASVQLYLYNQPCGSAVADVWNPRATQSLDVLQSLECDWQGTRAYFVGQAAIFGGDSSLASRTDQWANYAVEPMAHVAVEGGIEPDPTLQVRAGVWGMATAEVAVGARVVPRAGLPAGVAATDPIPVLLHYAVFASSQEQTVADATVSFSGPTVSWWCGAQRTDCDHEGHVAFMLPLDSPYLIRAVALANLYFTDTMQVYSGSAQAVADPFLTIDPSWAHADAFMVVQESTLHPGTWVEVTRGWAQAQPAPEPGVAALVLAGLAALGARRAGQGRATTRPPAASCPAA